MIRTWKMRLLAAVIGALALFGTTAAGCQQDCPPGTYYDADDGECEAPEGGDQFDD